MLPRCESAFQLVLLTFLRCASKNKSTAALLVRSPFDDVATFSSTAHVFSTLLCKLLVYTSRDFYRPCNNCKAQINNPSAFSKALIFVMYNYVFFCRPLQCTHTLLLARLYCAILPIGVFLREKVVMCSVISLSLHIQSLCSTSHLFLLGVCVDYYAACSAELSSS